MERKRRWSASANEDTHLSRYGEHTTCNGWQTRSECADNHEIVLLWKAIVKGYKGIRLRTCRCRYCSHLLDLFSVQFALILLDGLAFNPLLEHIDLCFLELSSTNFTLEENIKLRIGSTGGLDVWLAHRP